LVDHDRAIPVVDVPAEELDSPQSRRRRLIAWKRTTPVIEKRVPKEELNNGRLVRDRLECEEFSDRLPGLVEVLFDGVRGSPAHFGGR